MTKSEAKVSLLPRTHPPAPPLTRTQQPTRLKIAEELAPVAQSFFEFVYTGDYQVLDQVLDHLDMEEEDFHLEVLSLAKRFETSELAELAYEKMHEVAARKNVTVPEIDLATWLKEKDSMESSVVETAESSVGETTEPSVSEIVDSETGGVHLSQGFRTPSLASKKE